LSAFLRQLAALTAVLRCVWLFDTSWKNLYDSVHRKALIWRVVFR
jgi:hypothetical protein